MKAHLKEYTIVRYYGENCCISYDYWTSGDSEQECYDNLRKKLALYELFSYGVRTWKNICIDKVDIDFVK